MTPVAGVERLPRLAVMGSGSSGAVCFWHPGTFRKRVPSKGALADRDIPFADVVTGELQAGISLPRTPPEAESEGNGFSGKALNCGGDIALIRHSQP